MDQFRYEDRLTYNTVEENYKKKKKHMECKASTRITRGTFFVINKFEQIFEIPAL